MRVFKSVPVTKNHQNFYYTYLDARVLVPNTLQGLTSAKRVNS
jgi:hypothetical protein